MFEGNTFEENSLIFGKSIYDYEMKQMFNGTQKYISSIITFFWALRNFFYLETISLTN